MPYEAERRQFIRDKKGRFSGPYLEMPNGGVNAEEINVEPEVDEIEKRFLDSKTAKVIAYGGAATSIGAGTYLALSPRARASMDASNKASGANAFGFGATHKYNRKTKTWEKKVSKALGLKPVKMPKPLTTPKLPKPAVPPSTAVPATKRLSAGKPRVRETGVSKGYALVPTTKKERAKQRAQTAAGGALSGGVLSGGLTYGLNYGKLGARKVALQTAGIGAGLGAGISALTPTSKNKLVYKARDHRSEALLGTGVAAGGVAVGHNRIGNEINAAYQRRYDRKIATVEGTPIRDPRTRMPKDSAGRTVYSGRNERANVRSFVAEQKRAKATKLNNLRAARNRVPIGPGGRSAILRTSTALAVPSIWLGARGSVKKSVRRKDVDAAVLGGAGGFAAYQGGGMLLKPLDRRAERKIAMDEELTARAQAYQKASGRPKNAKAGDPSWRGYFRNYPKDLPGGRLKRTLAVTHTGKSGVALTTAAALTGAGTAVNYSRRRKVAKMHPEASMLHVPGAMNSRPRRTRRKKRSE